MPMILRISNGIFRVSSVYRFVHGDGPLMICPGNDRLWRKFAEALGHPEWPDEPRFKTNVERMQHRDLLLGMIADIMKHKSRDYWSGKLDALGCKVALCSGMDVDMVPDGFDFACRFRKPVAADVLADWVASVAVAPGA